jgi:multidrug resistance efflux pump
VWKSKRLWAIVLGVTAVAAGAAAWLYQHRVASRVASSAPPTPVVLPPEVTLPGAIRARHVVAVPAPVEGLLEQYMVQPGQEVFEGQLLARIHNEGLEAARQAALADMERVEARARALESALIAARLEASRARAEAERVRDDYQRAEKTFERQQFLFKEGAIAKMVFEKARKEFEAARQQYEAVENLAGLAEDRVASLTQELDSTRQQLEKAREALEEAQQRVAATEVHSPVNGILLARTRQPGDPVGPHVPDLLQIAVDLSVLEVVVEPEPPILERLSPGYPALVDVPEAPQTGLPGRVLTIEKDGHVIIEFSNPNPAIKPGMNAKVRIALNPGAPGSPR